MEEKVYKEEVSEQPLKHMYFSLSFWLFID